MAESIMLLVVSKHTYHHLWVFRASLQSLDWKQLQIHNLNVHFAWEDSVDARKEKVVSEEASLREWEKRLEEGRTRLHEGERLLNEREETIVKREVELKATERELAGTRSFLEKERNLIKQSDVELNDRAFALAEKERVCLLLYVSSSLIACPGQACCSLCEYTGRHGVDAIVPFCITLHDQSSVFNLEGTM